MKMRDGCTNANERNRFYTREKKKKKENKQKTCAPYFVDVMKILFRLTPFVIPVWSMELRNAITNAIDVVKDHLGCWRSGPASLPLVEASPWVRAP